MIVLFIFSVLFVTSTEVSQILFKFTINWVNRLKMMYQYQFVRICIMHHVYHWMFNRVVTNLYLLVWCLHCIFSVDSTFFSDKCTNWMNCQHHGYQHHTNCHICVCPDVFEGLICDELKSSGTSSEYRV